MIQGYVLAAVSILAVAGTAGGYIYGRIDGTAINEAKHLKANELVEDARDAMILAAGEAIGKIEIRHQTIRQEVEREIVEKPVFRECRNTADSFRLLNDALQNREPEPAGESLLPRVDTPS